MISAMRTLLVAFAALLLSGCWLGESFYAAADARPALPAGNYRAVNSNGDVVPAPIAVTLLPDGMTQIARGPDLPPIVVGFAPLDQIGRTSSPGPPKGNPRPDRERQLLRPAPARRHGDFLYYIPVCEDTETAARAAGATIEAPAEGPKFCRFADRARLENALRQLRPDPTDDSKVILRLTRIADGQG